MSKKRTDKCPVCKRSSRLTLRLRTNGRVYHGRYGNRPPLRENHLHDRVKIGKDWYATCKNEWHDNQEPSHWRPRWWPKYGDEIENVETPATTVNLHADPDELKARRKQKARDAKARRGKNRK